MNKFFIFCSGFFIALILSGVTIWLLVKESEKLHNSIFIAGYSVNIALAEGVLLAGESEKEKILKGELCQNIGILKNGLSSGQYDTDYIEVVVSESILGYMERLELMQENYCK